MTNSLQKVKTVVRRKIKKPTKQSALFALVIIVMISGLALLWFEKYNNASKQIVDKAECTNLTNNAGELLAQNKSEEAYKILKPQAGTCGTVPKQEDIKSVYKINDNVELLLYTRSLAVAAFRSGDKAQAKIYADQALKVREQITPELTSLISDQKKAELNLALYDLFTIQDDTYDDSVKYPSSAGSGQ